MACIAVISFGIMALGLSGLAPGNTVTVSVDGEVRWQGSLREDMTKTFSGADGYTCDIVVEKGRVWVERASCPDKSCVRQGAADRSGQTIVCLPARIVVEVSGRKADTPYDAVSR